MLNMQFIVGNFQLDGSSQDYTLQEHGLDVQTPFKTYINILCIGILMQGCQSHHNQISFAIIVHNINIILQNNAMYSKYIII